MGSAPEGGHLHEPRHAVRGGDARQPGRRLGLDGVERAAAALVEDADQVDDDVAPGDRRLQHRIVGGQVDAHRHDLADIAGRLEEGGADRVADRDAHHEPLGGQPPHHIAADEAGAAENRDATTLGVHGCDLSRGFLLSSLPVTAILQAGQAHRSAADRKFDKGRNGG